MLRRLAFIRAARNVGLSLDEIAAALEMLPDSRTPTRADWTRLSKDWRERLDDQIAGLMALRDSLDSCIGCGCLSLKRCAISNPADSAAVAGPGAVYLPKSLRRHGGWPAGLGASGDFHQTRSRPPARKMIRSKRRSGKSRRMNSIRFAPTPTG